MLSWYTVADVCAITLAVRGMARSRAISPTPSPRPQRRRKCPSCRRRVRLKRSRSRRRPDRPAGSGRCQLARGLRSGPPPGLRWRVREVRRTTAASAAARSLRQARGPPASSTNRARPLAAAASGSTTAAPISASRFPPRWTSSGTSSAPSAYPTIVSPSRTPKTRPISSSGTERCNSVRRPTSIKVLAAPATARRATVPARPAPDARAASAALRAARRPESARPGDGR